MSPEVPQRKPDGERWLELLGYGDLKGQPTGYEIDGRPVPVEQFDLLCGDHARPVFAALERFDPDDPRYGQFLDVARKVFEGYLGAAEPTSL